MILETGIRSITEIRMTIISVPYNWWLREDGEESLPFIYVYIDNGLSVPISLQEMRKYEE